MRVRILFAIVVTTVLAGCSDATSPTSPNRLRPQGPQLDELVCRGGYHVATRDDGTQFCEPDEGTDPESMTSGPVFRP